MKSAEEVVATMYQGDAFSQWLGIERQEVAPGYCRLAMRVRGEMTNGFSIAHGGISYALADSALAFAANGHGRQAVSIETQISHLRAVKAGEQLIAEAKEINRTRRTAVYQVRITNAAADLIAHFKGTVFIKRDFW